MAEVRAEVGPDALKGHSLSFRRLDMRQPAALRDLLLAEKPEAVCNTAGPFEADVGVLSEVIEQGIPVYTDGELKSRH